MPKVPKSLSEAVRVLTEAQASGQPPPELKLTDYDYFMPQLINDLIGQAEEEARSVLDWLQNADVRKPLDPSEFLWNPLERDKVEQNRVSNAKLMLESWSYKYAKALRTQALFEAIAKGRTGFVLFLRGFSLAQQFYQGFSIGNERDLEEYTFQFDLAQKIAPVPLLVVRNPAMSEIVLQGMSEIASSAEKSAESNTYLLDLDAGWMADVRELIGAASFIFVRSKIINPGLQAELNMVLECDRLTETYFSHPVEARSLIPRGPILSYDEAAVAHIRASADKNIRKLSRRPRPTCLWLQKDRRARAFENALFIFDMFNNMASRGQPMPRDMQTRLLFFALAASVGLERPDFMAMAYASYDGILQQYSIEQLPNRNRIAEFYFSIARLLAEGLDQQNTRAFNYQDLNALKALVASEDPDQVIRCAMECVAIKTR
jgi:hypothetical protein